jgi:hypothetical protein
MHVLHWSALSTALECVVYCTGVRTFRILPFGKAQKPSPKGEGAEGRSAQSRLMPLGGAESAWPPKWEGLQTPSLKVSPTIERQVIS